MSDPDLPRPAFGRAERSGGAAGRVPPHNVAAEESLLGAMLLSRDATAAAVEIVRADDFYKPAHGHIFDAITSLFAAGEPADPVTVAEELSRAGLLDAIGGPATLVTIQAATPATTSAARYARIVEEHALLRRLIGVAGEIAELGYDVPDDVTKAVDKAEALVFQVAQRRVSDTMAPIRDLLSESLDRLEQLYERGEAITGIPTGYVDLDELLSGMQPSNLIVVGARPAMGKALAVDSPVPTPTGWSTMAELRPGDTVFDERGEACRVLYVSPVFRDRPCYEIEFDDGSKLVTDRDHVWLACHHPDRIGRPRLVTTGQMLEEGIRAWADGRPKWHVAVAGALELNEADLPFDPYVLGCWLGDAAATSARPTGGDADVEHFRSEFETAGHPLPLPGDQVGNSDGIPETYLRASTKQRLALLQGLMDTGGTMVRADGTVELCLADDGLLAQARKLVCSLGHKPGPIRFRAVPLPDGRTARAWRFCWRPLDPVFRLPRKAIMQAERGSARRFGRATRRSVVAIRPVDSVPVRCIAVDSPSHLYLVGESMIPTHNTSFALGAATHVALQANQPVLIFSLEMSQIEVSQRILCAEARVDSTKVRTGKLSQGDWTQISHAVGRLAEAPIFVDDNPNVSVLEIRAKARRLKSATGGLGAVIIDYVQLMTGRTRAENRQVEVSEISRSLKILARELECPVVALAQLNRQLEQRADKRPMLSDLRETGALEQDSDVVIFLYRDEIYNPDTPDRGTAEILVAKHRSGPTGKVRLAWLDRYTKFANMAKGL
jgi:replicative DNA helicase